MTRYDKITPEGTGDLLFSECEARNRIVDRLRSIFEGGGYREVMTPGFEFYDVFSSNAMYYPQESLYRLIDSRGRLLTVRPDSTIPIARLTATRLKGHSLPLRLYYAQRVYRQQPELSGRRNEVLQAGVELIGAAGFNSDLEILRTGLEALQDCIGDSFRLELGHVGIYNLLMNRLEATAEDREQIHASIASKNYAALSDLLDRFSQDRTTRILRELPRLFGGEEALAQAQRLFDGYDAQLTEMVNYLEKVYRTLAAESRSDRIMVDFGLVNQAEYYSSLVFRGYMAAAGEPVLSGGRYDNLFRDFGDDHPATGFAVNVDQLADSLLRQDATATAPAKRPRLRIALTKGRLEKSVVDLMARAGYDVTSLQDTGRKLLLPVGDSDLEVVLAKAADVITYVEHGVCDVGIVGKDTIAEQGGIYYEILDLNVGKCRFALAVPKGRDFYGGVKTKRIATKYPGVAGAWFESRGMDVRIIRIEGSVELAPLLELADGIVDLVETGTTLRENGLEVIDDIREVSARMIVNVAGMKLKKKEIDEFAERLSRVIGQER